MPITLLPLPYEEGALEPNISAETLKLQHDKHHRAYVDKLNELIADKELEGLSLEEIIAASAEDPARRTIFNNAGQAWNHDLLWHSMTPDGGGEPQGNLRAAIEKEFGALEGFTKAFKQAAIEHFGSGWAWLVVHENGLAVVTTPNADTPILRNQRPLLVCDLWEHAYYVDYRNERPRYVSAFLDHLIDWDAAGRRFDDRVVRSEPKIKPAEARKPADAKTGGTRKAASR
jgi:Fe-Mn family superoxide dismutase